MIIFKKIVKMICILSILAVIMGIFRFFMTGYSSYLWLNWNLFLAILPILFAWIITLAKKQWIIFILLVLWLGFIPNAPYLVTDFIHLSDVGPKSLLWFDALMIFIYSMVGIISWFISFSLLRIYFHWKQWSVWIIAFLTGFGIYLGRYIRFNTWHVITHPLTVLEKIGDVIIYPLEHEPVMMMTLIFTVVLGTIYFALLPLISYEKTTN